MLTDPNLYELGTLVTMTATSLVLFTAVIVPTIVLSAMMHRLLGLALLPKFLR